MRICLRITVGTVAAALLLMPSVIMFIAWTHINLVVALVSILATIYVARRRPPWKWFAACITAFVVAIPPYPYLLFASEDRGWYFHLFSGYDTSTLPLARFGSMFVVAIGLCAALFWSLHAEARQP